MIDFVKVSSAPSIFHVGKLHAYAERRSTVPDEIGGRVVPDAPAELVAALALPLLVRVVHTGRHPAGVGK